MDKHRDKTRVQLAVETFGEDQVFVGWTPPVLPDMLTV